MHSSLAAAALGSQQSMSLWAGHALAALLEGAEARRQGDSRHMMARMGSTWLKGAEKSPAGNREHFTDSWISIKQICLSPLLFQSTPGATNRPSDGSPGISQPWHTSAHSRGLHQAFWPCCCQHGSSSCSFQRPFSSKIAKPVGPWASSLPSSQKRIAEPTQKPVMGLLLSWPACCCYHA